MRVRVNRRLNPDACSVRYCQWRTLLYKTQSKTDWDSAKKVLADSSFMDKLKNYDKVNG